MSVRKPNSTSDVDTRRIATASSRQPMHTLTRAGDERLVLRSSALTRGLSLAFLIAASVILFQVFQFDALGGNNVNNDASAGRFISGLLYLIGGGMWLAPQRVVFDKTKGFVNRRSWLFRYRYRLADVTAIQVIDGGGHNIRKSRTYYTRELNLVLSGASSGRVNLTNHSDHTLTSTMARELAAFLQVPLLDPFPFLPIDVAASKPGAGGSKTVKWFARFAAICYFAAFFAGLGCIICYLQQARLDELESSLLSVRAKLVSAEVREWNAGREDWSAFGKFAIDVADYRGEASGELIPNSYYEQNHISRTSRGRKIARANADEFLTRWQVGKSYDGYQYPDARDRIFFERPGAAANVENVRWLRNTALWCLAAGLGLSTFAAFIMR